MRRQLLQATRNATRTARHESSSAPITPFVCRNCRKAAGLQSVAKPNGARRTLTTSISRAQQAHAAEEYQPRRESITPQTHYDFFPQTFPNGSPPSSSFTPDLRQLRREFLQLQAKAHPDLASSGQKKQAEALSTRINEAYKVLQDPLKRAQYLLSLQGIDVEDESAKLSENELLMEVMEAREAVEEVENEEQLIAIREANSERIEQSVAILEAAFADGDMERAAQEAIRLRYWMNIEESIQGWEKGKGGGILHH